VLRSVVVGYCARVSEKFLLLGLLPLSVVALGVLWSVVIVLKLRRGKR